MFVPSYVAGVWLKTPPSSSPHNPNSKNWLLRGKDGQRSLKTEKHSQRRYPSHNSRSTAWFAVSDLKPDILHRKLQREDMKKWFEDRKEPSKTELLTEKVVVAKLDEASIVERSSNLKAEIQRYHMIFEKMEIVTGYGMDEPEEVANRYFLPTKSRCNNSFAKGDNICFCVATIGGQMQFAKGAVGCYRETRSGTHQSNG